MSGLSGQLVWQKGTLTLIQLWKNYTLIQFCGVRADPGYYFKLNVILHQGLLSITFHSSTVTISVIAGSARTPHNWMRVNTEFIRAIPFEILRGGTGKNPGCPQHFILFAYVLFVCPLRISNGIVLTCLKAIDSDSSKKSHPCQLKEVDRLQTMWNS